MNEDRLETKWESLVYDIEFNLDKRVSYDAKYCKNLICHCSINKLLKNCNEELLKHDANYWVNLIYGEREFIYKYLEAYSILKDYYSISEDIIDNLKVNYFSKDYKQALLTASLKDVIDEVIIKYYGVSNICMYKIGIKNDDGVQEFSVNYIKAKNPVDARLKAEKEFGFSQKASTGLFSGSTMYVFVEQILDINLEYEKINKINTDIEASFILKNRLKERFESLMQITKD
jgi:hypothetical protein